MFLRSDREHAAHPSRRPAGAPQGEEIKNSPHPDVRGLSRALKGDVRRRTALVAALCIGLSFVLCCDLTVSASAQNAGSALVEGFRSAKFGADEKTVRAAIKADFGLEGKAVSAEENPVEKTTALVATVDALEPGGKAQIAYILGYKSKKLIQVNVVWGAPVDPGATAEKLTGTAVLLRNYFTQQSFAPDRRQQDQRLQDGSILSSKERMRKTGRFRCISSACRCRRRKARSRKPAIRCGFPTLPTRNRLISSSSRRDHSE